MKKRSTSLGVISVGLVAVASLVQADPLAIKDAEAAGFERDQQQIFQLVEARDGWSGDWAGDRVELYEYESADDVPADTFEPMIQEGNVSGWVDLCQVDNLVMLSKGESACGRLAKLPME